MFIFRISISFAVTWEFGDMVFTLPALMKPVDKDHAHQYWTHRLTRKGPTEVKPSVSRFPVEVYSSNHALPKQKSPDVETKQNNTITYSHTCTCLNVILDIRLIKIK